MPSISSLGVNPFCGHERNRTLQNKTVFTRRMTSLTAHFKKNAIPVLRAFELLEVNINFQKNEIKNSFSLKVPLNTLN